MKNSEISKVLIAVACILVFAFLEPFGGLSRSAMLMIGIFIGVVYLWMASGISWPSLFCLLALAVLPEISMTSLITSSFGNSVIAFLIFSFCCSHALNETQFTRRCALWFLSLRAAQKGAWAFMLIYFLSILAIGSCMSTTVVVLIYLTINEEIFSMLGLEKGNKFAAALTMGLVITASISGAMTPIAHVFPLMALSTYANLTGQAISYAAYMAAGIPAALLAVLVMLLIFRFVLRPDTSAIRGIDIDSLKHSLTPADAREKATVAIFFGVVALWVLPELLKNVLPAAKWISAQGTVMPPMLGTVLLCIIKVQNKPLLTLDAGAKSVPWPSIFMGASALALGSALTNADIGLLKVVEQSIAPAADMFSGMTFILVLVALTAVMTNVGSNMVTVTVVCTVALPVVAALSSLSINAGALAVVLGMMSTYAFATPPAMTTVVLGTGSGWTTNAQMAKYGFLFLIPCVLIVTLVAYPIAALLL